MKKITQCLRALSYLAISTIPALTNAQSWQWASAPTAIVDPGGTSAQGGSRTAGIALDAAGNTVVVGSFYGSITLGSTTLTSAGYSDIFVARISPSSQWLQATRAGGPGSDVASAAISDAAGNITLTGICSNLAAFGSNTLVSSSSNYSMVFVARLAATALATRAPVPAEISP